MLGEGWFTEGDWGKMIIFVGRKGNSREEGETFCEEKVGVFGGERGRSMMEGKIFI